MNEVEQKLTQFIETKLILDREPPALAPNESLLSGVLDSVNVLRLVVFIEEQFGIQVQDEELLPENFQNVRALADFIRRKVGATPRPTA